MFALPGFRRVVSCSPAIVALVAVLAAAEVAQSVRADELKAANIARTARVTASSQYSEQYRPESVIDGKMPAEASRADLDAAWCVRGDTAGDAGWLRFEWEKPVTIAEIVYWGRTSWMLTECWKDYEILVDGAKKPVVRGRLARRHGPQRIALPSVRARSVTLK